MAAGEIIDFRQLERFSRMVLEVSGNAPSGETQYVLYLIE